MILNFSEGAMNFFGGEDLELTTSAFSAKSFSEPDLVKFRARRNSMAEIDHKAGGEPESETGKKDGGKTPGKKALKQKIRALKSEKEGLRQANNKTALSRLRKRMKRLKRLTKRAA
jgi:hypothetical protein